MKKIALQWLSVSALSLFGLGLAHPQAQPAIPAPDDRFKADILVIVAHPDDDTGASTYLSKAVFDEGKRVAVIFSTRGNAGPNAVGMEQSKALSDVRQMEAYRSLAARGITNVWFLCGQDTPTQDVLHSLETVGHGESLEEVVRIIRLTRPEVILTWLPAYVAGENHGDHQASAVLAVEGFDLAANPAAFPEQLTAPRMHRGVGNYGEGLLPWQPKKLYFFSDATHPDFLKGHGPAYLASDISRAKKVPFADLNRVAWENYATQLDFNDDVLRYFINLPEYFVLGKSLVPSPVDADVYAGIKPGSIPFVPELSYTEPLHRDIQLELGGPWAFYKQFYRAHGLASLNGLMSPQTALSEAQQLWVPLLLSNGSDKVADIKVHADLPAGWTGGNQDAMYHLDPGVTYPIQVFLTAPKNADPNVPQTLRWMVSGDGTVDSKVELSVYMEYNYVPQ